MINNETKGQHYVPQTYLKKFADSVVDPFQIPTIPKAEWQTAKVKLIGVKQLCKENDVYTLPGKTPQERLFIETFYNKSYEQHYGAMYQMLIDPKKVLLAPNERHLIISTISTMLYRTVYWRNLHNSAFDSILEQMYRLTVQHQKDGFTMEGKYVSIKNKSLEQLQQEFRDRGDVMRKITQLDIALKLIKVRLQKDRVVVAKITDSNGEFITSDNPVIYSNPFTEDPIPFSNTNMLQLPLDNKHMLTISPSDEYRNMVTRMDLIDNETNDMVLASNYQQLKSSVRFIIGNTSALDKFFARIRAHVKQN